MTATAAQAGQSATPTNLPPPPGRPVETLYQEARRAIAPILRRAGEKGMGTAMYLSALELRRHFPALSANELETLLQRALKGLQDDKAADAN